MSTPQERLEVIEHNYHDSYAYEAYDLAKAPTPEAVTAILANLANARLTYFQAIAAQLDKNAQNVESAFQAARAAAQEVTAARRRAAAPAELISKLQSSTQKATDLLNAAKT